jgi:hypothetical protein
VGIRIGRSGSYSHAYSIMLSISTKEIGVVPALEVLVLKLDNNFY